MAANSPLHVGKADLGSVRVASRLCIFPTTSNRPDKKIRGTFQALREYVVTYGLDPDTLIHIGIPTMDQDQLLSYECCLEFPLPMESDHKKVSHKTLPGGHYAILRVKKNPFEIRKAIRRFYGDYVPDNQIIIDEKRAVYEIYTEDFLEYCVPVLD